MREQRHVDEQGRRQGDEGRQDDEHDGRPLGVLVLGMPEGRDRDDAAGQQRGRELYRYHEQRDAEHRAYAAAALEAVEQRPAVADDRGHADRVDEREAGPVVALEQPEPRREHRDDGLEAVQRADEDAPALADRARDVRGAGVQVALLPYVLAGHQPRHDDGVEYRAR